MGSKVGKSSFEVSTRSILLGVKRGKMDYAKDLQEDFGRTYCITCKNSSELRIIKKEICVLEDMAIKPCDRPICNSKSVLITVCVSQKTHTCNYWKSILYNLAYKFYDYQLKRGRRQRGNVSTDTHQLFKLFKISKYCFDNAIYNPEFGRNVSNILVYRNKWWLFFFFYSAILKYVPLNKGVQPATKWHTDKMRNKFMKIWFSGVQVCF